jgi:glycosyltransferase involved in cell wall biosynthesis
MQEVNPLVSIIIPAYNAARYLKETIGSIKAQSIHDWEIIVVDDGSKDETAAIAIAENDDRIKVLSQINAGVSTARNNGFEISNGKYVVFFDADDLMEASFLESRINALDNDPNSGYACGWIETFPQKTSLRRGAAYNPEQEILFFDPEVATVPSNYMIRSDVMKKHHLRFNKILISTADRFFILQLAKVTYGCVVDYDRARLLYRISADSMSHKVDSGLVFDNLKFYHEIRNAELLPKQEARFRSQFFFSLALGFAKVGKPLHGISYLMKSVISHPAVFVKLLYKRVKRTFTTDR